MLYTLFEHNPDVRSSITESRFPVASNLMRVFTACRADNWDIAKILWLHRICGFDLQVGCREHPPRGAPWVSGLVGHFVQTWPDSECSHTVQCLDCGDLN